MQRQLEASSIIGIHEGDMNMDEGRMIDFSLSLHPNPIDILVAITFVIAEHDLCHLS